METQLSRREITNIPLRKPIEELGWELRSSALDEACLGELAKSAFGPGSAGARCLLDLPSVANAARRLGEELLQTGHLPACAVAIQAIAFDKTAMTNWKVAWHQDLMFPFARPVKTVGFGLPTKKEGVDYARPPRDVLEALVAVRLHIDECDEANGPLRVSPGTHQYGILRSAEIAEYVDQHGQVSCLARRGDILLMKPLTLHASSQATRPAHRRVLHFVYHAGVPIAEPWHHALGLA